MDINSRIRTIREKLSDGSNKKFADTLGKSPQYTSNICRSGKSVGSDVLDEILSKYKEISEEWLKLGIGAMLKADNRDVSIFAPEDLPLEIGRLYRAPIFESYPVSAGDMGMSAVRNQKPDGYAYTTMPGVTFFPIVGCSFEPIIKAGHYVGTVKLDSWDRLDTEKIYFILNHWYQYREHV